MVKSKRIREKGKISFSRYFRRFKDNDSVAVTIEKSLVPGFPKRLQGRTGKVIGKRGRNYIVKIKDQTKPKEFIIHPVHLKKLEMINKK